MSSVESEVATRFLSREVYRRASSSLYSPRHRTAASSFPRSDLQAICRAVTASSVLSFSISSIASRVVKLVKSLSRVRGAWDSIKESLGVDGGPVDMARRLGEILADGKKALAKVLGNFKDIFPINLYFLEQGKAPTVTDLLKKIVERVPAVGKMLERVKSGVKKLDELVDRHLPTLKRPLLAAIFIWVWFNVAELSWDVPGIVKGFLGKISVGELFESLPESGLGLVASAFGLGYGALPVTIILRVVWLVASHYVSWNGHGFTIHWDKLGLAEPDESVALA